MNRLLILKLGETFPELAAHHGDFEDWIVTGLGMPERDIQVLDARRNVPPAPGDCASIVITGSHAMVSDREPWSESVATWLAGAVDHGIPTLGICYGHQLLAHALGGQVGPNPRGREFGSVAIRLDAIAATDSLFRGLPGNFLGQTSHTESVLRLPPGARRLASSDGDPHQAFRVGRAWGVQFHPEFDVITTRFYLQQCRDELLAEGQDPDSLVRTVADTPEAAGLLHRFAQDHVSRRSRHD